MTPITLPGDLPGLLDLLVPGCCVVLPDGRRAVYGGGYALSSSRWRSVCLWVEDGAAGMPHFDGKRPDLDLRASTSRAREWLAERCGLDASGGTLWRQAMGRPGVWVLEAAFTRRDFAASVGSDVEHVVPALATIRATDPDAALLALAACCLHVAEVARG